MSATTRGVELRVPLTLDLGSLLAFEAALESIADAGPPLEIRWHGGSFIDVPLWRE